MEEQNLEQKTVSFDKTKFILPSSILIAAILISGTILYSKGFINFKSDQANIGGERIKVSVDDDPVLGNEKAKVTIIEFSDFQCPFCRQFWRDSFFNIKKDYVDMGKARFVYRDFPLSFHENAPLYAEAAQCANEQNKFWEMHDKIFQEQDKKGQGTISGIALEDVKSWAASLGFNLDQFNKCLITHKYKNEIDKDFNDGSRAGVSGTPTTFINGRAVVGSQPYSVFKSIIDSELK